MMTDFPEARVWTACGRHFAPDFPFACPSCFDPRNETVRSSVRFSSLLPYEVGQRHEPPVPQSISSMSGRLRSRLRDPLDLCFICDRSRPRRTPRPSWNGPVLRVGNSPSIQLPGCPRRAGNGFGGIGEPEWPAGERTPVDPTDQEHSNILL